MYRVHRKTLYGVMAMAYAISAALAYQSGKAEKDSSLDAWLVPTVKHIPRCCCTGGHSVSFAMYAYCTHIFASTV